MNDLADISWSGRVQICLLSYYLLVDVMQKNRIKIHQSCSSQGSVENVFYIFYLYFKYISLQMHQITSILTVYMLLFCQ